MNPDEPASLADPGLLQEFGSIPPSSPLMVSVDFMDLLNRYDEDKAFEVLGRLKDLLA
jgi:hypothetical protein